MDGAIINNTEPVIKHHIAMWIVSGSLNCKNNILPIRNSMEPKIYIILAISTIYGSRLFNSIYNTSDILKK